MLRTTRNAGPTGLSTPFAGRPDTLGTLGDTVIEARQREATVTGERGPSCPISRLFAQPLQLPLCSLSSPRSSWQPTQPTCLSFSLYEHTPRPSSSDFREIEGQKLGPQALCQSPPEPLTPWLRQLRMPFFPHPSPPCLISSRSYRAFLHGQARRRGCALPCHKSQRLHIHSRRVGRDSGFSTPTKYCGVFERSLGNSRRLFSKDSHLATRHIVNNPSVRYSRGCVLLKLTDPELSSLGGKTCPPWRCPQAPRSRTHASPVTCPDPHLALAGIHPPESQRLFLITLIPILLNFVGPPSSPPYNVPWPLHVNSEIKLKFQFADVNCPCDLNKWDKGPGRRFCLDS